MIRSWLTLFAFVLTALCGSLALPVAAQTPINSYTAVRIGGVDITAYGINNAAQVVGQGNGHAFLWQNGVMTDLSTLGGSYSIAYGINNSGQVVGLSITTAGATHAFLWTAVTGMRDLGTLGGAFSEAYGVNDVGQVVGTATTATGVQHAFLWQNGQMYDLGTLIGYTSSTAYGVNGSGQVVGVADANGQKRAFRWTPTALNGTTGAMVALHSSGGNAAYGINASGQAMGEALVTDGSWHAFLWDSLGAHDLGVLSPSGPYGPQNSAAYAINAAGLATGSCETGSFYDIYYDTDGNVVYVDRSSHTFLWDSQNGIRDLNALANGHAPVSAARGINASGQIAANGGKYGVYSDTTGTAYLLTPSPLPTRPFLWVNVGDTRVSLSWSESPGAVSYTLKRATTVNGPYTTLASGAATTYTDTAVVNGTTYFYSLSAVNAYGESEPFNVSATPIGAPTGLTATAGDQQVSLSWNASAGASYYYIFRSTTPGGPYNFVYPGYGGYPNGTNFVDYGDWYDGGAGEGGGLYVVPLQNGVAYYYVVVAVNAAGQSGFSNEASATPMSPPPPLTPAAPTGLTATAGDTRISLSWNASVGASYYNIKRATSSGGPYIVVSTPYGTGYTDETLTNGTTYYYRVSAVNAGGESQNSSQVSAIPYGPPPPAAPTGLTATAAAAKKRVDLKWKQSASAGVVQNRIYRSTASSGSYSLVTTITAGTSYTNTSLTSGVTYYYAVTAVSSNGKESAYSNQASAKAR